MQKKTIFLTGGSGFIGKHIIETFSDSYTILSPSHSELDLLNEQEVEKFITSQPIDIILHTANKGGSKNTQHLSNTFTDNIRMFYNLVRLEKYYEKFIFLGSGAEYDKRNSLLNIKETDFDMSVPIDDYGYYKYLCSKYIEKSEKIVNLRLFGIFGSYEDYSIRFISQAICKSIFNIPITINKNVEFTYLYIKDFLTILNYFLSSQPKEKFYNIGPQESVDLLLLANKIKKITQNTHQIIINDKVKANAYTADTNQLLKEIPDIQFTSLDDSINELYYWYLSQKAKIDKKVLLGS